MSCRDSHFNHGQVLRTWIVATIFVLACAGRTCNSVPLYVNSRTVGKSGITNNIPEDHDALEEQIWQEISALHEGKNTAIDLTDSFAHSDKAENPKQSNYAYGHQSISKQEGIINPFSVAIHTHSIYFLY